jgi:hypothetical protein
MPCTKHAARTMSLMSTGLFSTAYNVLGKKHTQGGDGVADRKEKRGVVDSFLSGYRDAQQIVDPSSKSSHTVVATTLTPPQLIVAPTEGFTRANINPLSMGNDNDAWFISHPRPMRGDGHPVTYRTTRQKHMDEEITAIEQNQNMNQWQWQQFSLQLQMKKGRGR